ncbi:MAG: GNAT family N-acetyltransferase, partial [Rhizobiaceae bacterium]
FVLHADAPDISRIAELHGLNFARGWSELEIEQVMERPEVTLLVAREIGAPNKPASGFNIYRQTTDEAEILSIAVDQSKRGSGLGDRLMRAAIASLQGDRVKELFLEVDASNTAAIGLYRKLHFEQVGERPGYYDNEGGKSAYHALVMRRALL